MSDAIRRALRTFFQAFIGVILAQSAPIALSASKGEYILDIDWLMRISVSGVAAAVIAVLTFAQNWLEDNTKFPSMLKAQASSGQNPVTHDPKE